MTGARRFLAACAACLALTGCVRATADTTIGDNETFSQHTIVAYGDSVASQITEFIGADVDALVGGIDESEEFQEFADRYPGQVSLERYTSGDLEGIELTLSDIPIDDFTDASTRALASVDASATLTRDGDDYVLDIRRGGEDALAALGIGRTNLELAQASVDVAATFTFPGVVTEATAGQIDGHTVTLGLADLATAPHIRIVAGAQDAIDWGPFLLWGGIAAGFAVVIGGATWLVIDDRRKSRTSHLPRPRL